MAIKTGKGSIPMQIGLRVNPVLPFGWTNAILGVWEVPIPGMVVSSMFGCQMDILVKTNIGVIFKTVGSIASEGGNQETDDIMQRQLVTQLGILVVTLIAVCCYSRWIMRNVMPKGGDKEKEEDDEVAKTVGE